MVKRLTLFLFFCLMVLPLAAQKTFSIESFEMDPFDTSAQNPEYQKIDGSGDKYAIIKVTSKEGKDDLNAYHFNFGYMNSMVEPHGKAVWVYVQKHAKHVTVSREGYETVEKYDLHTTIQAGKTYRMVLSDKTEMTPLVVQQQMVLFQIEPTDARAVVMVVPEGGNEFMLGNQDETGGVAKSLPFGTYTYKVHSEMYKSSEGRFTLNDVVQMHEEKVTLAPNFSTITLNVSSGADIYINGMKKGSSSWNGRLKPGTYQIECRQEHHRSSKQTITVAENQSETIELTAPTPIVGILAVTSTPLGADILIDGVMCGKTPMNVVNVLEGKHELKLKKNDYQHVQQLVDVVENQVKNVHLELKKGFQAPQLKEDEIWVDLGLSVLWASHNVGAKKPQESGDYFAWGEFRPKSIYIPSNSFTYQKKWIDISGEAHYDAATANWRAPARIPTKEEWQELVENTTTQWATYQGVKGCWVTSKKNGKSVFLPAAGVRERSSLHYAGEYGLYWSSEPNEENNSQACCFGLNSGNFGLDWYNRSNGCTVRPVRNK